MDYVKRYADAGLQSKLVTAKTNGKTGLRLKAFSGWGFFHLEERFASQPGFWRNKLRNPSLSLIFCWNGIIHPCRITQIIFWQARRALGRLLLRRSFFKSFCQNKLSVSISFPMHRFFMKLI